MKCFDNTYANYGRLTITRVGNMISSLEFRWSPSLYVVVKKQQNSLKKKPPSFIMFSYGYIEFDLEFQ